MANNWARSDEPVTLGEMRTILHDQKIETQEEISSAFEKCALEMEEFKEQCHLAMEKSMLFTKPDEFEKLKETIMDLCNYKVPEHQEELTKLRRRVDELEKEANYKYELIEDLFKAQENLVQRICNLEKNIHATK